jgi:cytochrome c oxidase subunit 2
VKKLRSLLAFLGLFGIGEALADYQLNLTEGVTELSKDIHDLHMLIFWICVVIGVIVYGILVYSLIHHRKSRGVVPATFHENTKLEIVWTVIPFLILLGMAIPATKVMIKAYDASGADMTIKVTGYQWKWKYDYLDEGIGFFSTLDAKSNQARQMNSEIDPATVENYLLEVDHPLVIPVGKKIRFLFTGADVIHSWWVPDLGWKKDTIPGFITDAWAKVEKPGTYRGQCTELCGRDHGFMPIVVIAKPEEEYQAWLAGQKGGKVAGVSQENVEPLAAVADTNPDSIPPGTAEIGEGGAADRSSMIASGREVYETHCAGCHQSNGEGIPGLFPAISKSPVVNGPVAGHIGIILNGKPPLMSSFRNVLKPQEIAAVVTYQRNALGNNTGDVVRPADVTALE